MASGLLAGELIKTIRSEKKLTLSGFSERIKEAGHAGWDPARLSRVERDELSLTRTAIKALADGFGMKPEVLHLQCLQQHYPKLASTEVGKLLGKIENLLDT